jgi:hypothetical protein
MDLGDIKKLIGEEGKLIIVDNNEPSLVVMSYNDYKKMKDNNSQVVRKNDEIIIEELPIKNKPMPEEAKTNSFRIDDLPF